MEWLHSDQIAFTYQYLGKFPRDGLAKCDTFNFCVTIGRAGKKPYTLPLFSLGPGYANKQGTAPERKPTEYDILACLQKYDIGTIDDFAHEYGYLQGDAKISKILADYTAVQTEYREVLAMFGPEYSECFTELRNIN